MWTTESKNLHKAWHNGSRRCNENITLTNSKQSIFSCCYCIYMWTLCIIHLCMNYRKLFQESLCLYSFLKFHCMCGLMYVSVDTIGVHPMLWLFSLWLCCFCYSTTSFSLLVCFALILFFARLCDRLVYYEIIVYDVASLRKIT